LAGSLRPVKGDFELAGRIRYLAEDLTFDSELSAGAIFRALIPRRRRDEAFELAGQIELDARKDYGKLSTGNRRKVLLVLAECSNLSSEPEVLFLDEPFSGLDTTCREIFEQRWSRSNGQTLRLVSCHPDYDRMEITSALVIHHGRIAHQAGADQSWQDLRGLLN
jgi:ABC-type multidrug transport system ATPase subunit